MSGISGGVKLGVTVDQHNAIMQYDSSITYQINEMCFYDAVIYKAIAVTTNERPDTHAAAWTAV